MRQEKKSVQKSTKKRQSPVELTTKEMAVFFIAQQNKLS
jgi:hypothetical protein